MEFTLEICVDSVESAVAAREAGAGRLELCCALSDGGLTPGWGLLKSVLSNVDIPVNVLIRPRGSDFLYTDNEFEIMKKDIEMCGESGAAGVVFGILNADSSVDTERTTMLVNFASPMTVTFHRTFDLCPDPFRALEDIISTGACRLLTSGQKPLAAEGAKLLKKLLLQSKGRIIIMPRGGLSDKNIAEIARLTGASEFHLSAGRTEESGMVYGNIEMLKIISGSSYPLKRADRNMIISIIEKLKMV